MQTKSLGILIEHSGAPNMDKQERLLVIYARARAYHICMRARARLFIKVLYFLFIICYHLVNYSKKGSIVKWTKQDNLTTRVPFRF